jgi:arylsulfatase A-like enzyme
MNTEVEILESLCSWIPAFAGMTMVFSAPVSAQAPNPPKLVVVISVDQFGANLFDEYRPHFTAGLKRLASGTVFRNGYQGQAATETCPGHSTIMTGSLPARTGIIANSWYDWSAARPDKRIYCAGDERVPGSTFRNYTVSPAHLKVPTLGDLLKKLSPASQNVAVAGKDRAAVMMSGHVADQRWYWGGKAYVTDLKSTPVPPSVPLINAKLTSFIALPQAPLVPPPYCQSKARPIALSDGQTVGAGKLGRAANDYEAFRESPDWDGATLAMAGALIHDLKLGRDQAPDILSIGLSATDYVGHAYGSEGEEMCLQMFGLDRELGDFLRALDSMKLDYAVVLTADHGVEDLAERAGAPRVDAALSAKAVGAEIAKTLGIDGRVLVGGIAGDVYFDPALSPSQRAKAEAEALRIFRAHPQVEAVYTKAELEKVPLPTGSPDKWTLIQRARASFDAQRSGDLIVLMKKGVSLLSKPGIGDVATHGSPWDYDRRVPILFWRPGMAAQDREEAVDTSNIMPTIAAMIGVPVDPKTIDGRCLAGIGTIACPAP